MIKNVLIWIRYLTKGGFHMKKLAFLFAASALLVACGDKEETTNVPDNAPVEQNSTDTTTTPSDAPFSFTHFDLDIEYTDNKSYEVSYENEATDQLIPIFESFTFDANTDSNAVIDEVLQKFGQPDNFLSVEIEIKYADGTVKEYRRTQ